MDVSCGVFVLSPQGSLLMGHAFGSSHWDIPKGVGEPGETPRQTAVRETAEETGVRLSEEGLLDLGPFAYRPGKSLHLFATLSEPVDVASLVCTSLFRDARGRTHPELDRFRWVPIGQVPGLCARSLARLLTESIDLAALHARLLGAPRRANSG